MRVPTKKTPRMKKEQNGNYLQWPSNWLWEIMIVIIVVFFWVGIFQPRFFRQRSSFCVHSSGHGIDQLQLRKIYAARKRKKECGAAAVKVVKWFEIFSSGWAACTEGWVARGCGEEFIMYFHLCFSLLVIKTGFTPLWPGFAEDF